MTNTTPAPSIPLEASTKGTAMTERIRSLSFWKNAVLYVGSAVFVGYIAAQVVQP